MSGLTKAALGGSVFVLLAVRKVLGCLIARSGQENLLLLRCGRTANLSCHVTQHVTGCIYICVMLDATFWYNQGFLPEQF